MVGLVLMMPLRRGIYHKLWRLVLGLGVPAIQVFTTNHPISVQAHSLGLHGLSGADPTGDPQLPAIRGAFEVELKVRFNDITTGTYHNLFEYEDDAEENTVWLGQLTSTTVDDTVLLRVKAPGSPTTTECSGDASGMIEPGQKVHTYKFGVDSSGTARIFVDGALVVVCTDMLLPLDVPRHHFVGSGPMDALPTVDRTLGAILGVRVTNLGEQQDPQSDYAWHNFPAQPFSSPFVVSFYARFDNMSAAGGRKSQRIFDFGNGLADNNIVCGQFKATKKLQCEVYDGGTVYSLRAPTTIVEGEFAFWHFGMEYDSTNDVWPVWIEKDGVRVKEESWTLQRQHVFRRNMLFGTSHWVGDAEFEGAILGFRLDRGGQIS